MRRVIASILVLFVLSGSIACASVEKVTIKGMELFKIDGEPQVRIELEVRGKDGMIFVQASTNYDGKDYLTEPVGLSLEMPQPFFVVRFAKKDFRRVNLLEGTNEEIPEFAEGKDVTVYVYEEKHTSQEGKPEDIKQEIAQYGYALRGVLAKGTKSIELTRK